MEVWMRTVRQLLIAPLIVILGFTSTAFAQQRHAVDPAALAATVSQHAAQQDADRAAIREALARSAVRDVAAKAGMDVERLAAAVDTLSGTQLQQAADAARQVNETLVGGASTIVISTTTIIIILLVLLLIVVAVD
jgi:hypothetical protein